MAVVIYKSTDGSAPTLSGTAGSLTTLLDAILVGSGGIAYGSTASAGWTIEYTTTNIRVYRPGAGARHYLRVNDSAAVTGSDETTGSITASEARIRAYETMTGISTGLGYYPTTGQLGPGIIWQKSKTADATTRTWIAAADSSTLMLFVLTTEVASGYMAGYFGDFYSLKGSSDPYRSILIGRSAEVAAGGTTFAGEALQVCAALGTAVSGQYISRPYPYTAYNSTNVGKHIDSIKGSTALLVGTVASANGPDSGYYISPIWIHDTSSYIYGYLRGIWAWLHAVAGAADADTLSLSDSSRAFLFLKGSGSNGGSTIGAIYLLETGNTWDTN